MTTRLHITCLMRMCTFVLAAIISPLPVIGREYSEVFVGNEDIKAKPVMDDDDLRLLVGRKVGTLDLSNSNVTDSGLIILSEDFDCKILELGHTRITARSLAPIGTMSSIWLLDLRGTNISGPYFFKELRRLVNLELLILIDTPVSEKELSQLGQMNRLEHLDLSRTKVSRWPDTLSDQFPNLRLLNLVDTTIKNADIEAIAKLQHLTDIFLAGTNISGPEIRRLLSNNLLESVSLGRTTVSGVANDLSLLPNLVYLNLSHTPLTEAGLIRLGQSKSIRKLDISGVPVGELGMKAIAGLPLERLTIADVRLSAKSISLLSSNTSINYLNLSNTQITDAAVGELRPLEAVRELFLDDNPMITDAGIVNLATLKNIESLHLRGTDVSPAAINELIANLPRLKYLDVRNTNVRDKPQNIADGVTILFGGNRAAPEAAQNVGHPSSQSEDVEK